MANVKVVRTDDGMFYAENERGARIDISGSGDDASFTPVELLLAALGACGSVTVEPLTAQRGHRLTKLDVDVSAEKVKPNLLGPITVKYDVTLPAGDPEAAKVFTAVAHRVHERHCTVARTLEEGAKIELELPELT